MIASFIVFLLKINVLTINIDLIQSKNFIWIKWMQSTITMFPAENGDAFLISMTLENSSFHMLVDAGYKKTFNNHIKNKLIEIRKNGGCLDLLVVTHIDSDHISGVIGLFEQNGSIQNPEIIQINEIWYNSYRHLISLSNSLKPSLNYRDQSCINAIEAQGYKQNEVVDKNTEISAEQGLSLAKLIDQYGCPWNKRFSGLAVSNEKLTKVVFSDNIQLILLSPSKEKLDQLEKFWRDELGEKGFLASELLANSTFEKSFEFLCSHEYESSERDTGDISSESLDVEQLSQEEFKEDERAANGSSIGFVLEYYDKKFLFLGDAHPALIESSLKNYYKENCIWFDLIKISHHGSKQNTSQSLLNIIDSDIFLISTKGNTHNHPDSVTIAKIINRPSVKKRRLYFNYQNKTYNLFNQDELMKKYNFSIELCGQVNF